MKVLVLSACLVMAISQPLAAQQEGTPPATSVPAANSPANGEDNAALLQHIRDLEDRIIALEGKVRMLQSTAAPATPPSAPAAPTPENASMPAATQTEASITAAPPQVTTGGAGGAAAKALNPDISVI